MQNAKCGIGSGMDRNTVAEKSFAFAVRIVNLNRHLKSEKNEHTLSNQILRSGTSIGANVSEAQRGQSKADFLSKMNIALKEANETDYWLRLLCKTDYITQAQYLSLHADLSDILALLTAICKTAGEKRMDRNR